MTETFKVQSRSGKNGLEFYYLGPANEVPGNRPIQHIFDGRDAEARANAAAETHRLGTVL